jgi:hypothetical protein
MSGVKGRSGGRNRIPDRPRYPNGRLKPPSAAGRAPVRVPCACGGWKSKTGKQCKACWQQHQTTQTTCACGHWKSSGATHCLDCERQRQQRTVPTRICEQCGGEFRRRSAGPRHRTEVFRFCSKKCWGGFRTAQSQTAEARALAATRQQAQSFARELMRAQQLELQSVCACGAAKRPLAQRCRACARLRTRTRLRGRYQPHEPAQSCCPDCGAQFITTRPNKVFCSDRCHTRYTKKGRYPSIAAITPITERNRIAALVALVRSAQRRIHLSPSGA